MSGDLLAKRARNCLVNAMHLTTAALVAFTAVPASALQLTVADSRNASFACQDVGTDPTERARLSVTISELTATLALLRSEERKSSDLPPQTASGEEAALARQRQRSDIEAKLSTALSREDCLTALELPSETHRGPGAPPAKYVRIPEFYITERQRSGCGDARSTFSAELRKSGLESGTVDVVLASKLRFDAQHIRPKSWTEARQPANSVDFAVEAPRAVAESSDGVDVLPDQLKQSEAKKLLVFIHGFNVSYVEAVVRGAQLAHDLEFNGDLLTYSWASMGSVLSYGRDEDTARISAHHVRAILQAIDRLKNTTARI